VITVLAATLLVAGVSAVLAAILLVAERRLVAYGTCTIDINQGARTLEVEGGGTLLASLMANRIFIPSACGGRGTCAYCKVKVLEGAGPLGPTEEPLLSKEEVAANVRISCQCKVRQNVRIEIPEHLFSVKEYRARVETISDLTHDIKLLRIRLLDPDTLEFVAGQYVQLQAPAYGDNPDPVYRAYSMASPPSDSHVIELIIRLVPGGICTTWVFEMLKEGDEVLLNGPYGDFRLSDSQREMIWIAGGSGMAPFWSIIRHMDEKGIARKCTYFFGANKKRDMFLVDEFRAIEKKHDWFTFVPALSDPAAGSDWDGERGLITEVVDRRVEAGGEKEGYLCGSPGLINAAIKIIKAKGVPENCIYYDKFE